MKNAGPHFVHFYFLGRLPIAVLATRYHPDIILVNCGSSGNSTTLDDRVWMGDVGSNFVSSWLLNQTPLSAKPFDCHGFSVNTVPYMTARFSHSQFTYTFPVKPDQKFIGLHFFPTCFSPEWLHSQPMKPHSVTRLL